MQHSSRYIVLFALAVCGVCSVFVASAAVSLKDRQIENQRLDVQKKVLGVAGLMKPGESLEREEITRLFSERVEARVVDLESGSYAESIAADDFDQRVASKDPERSRPAPPNGAKVLRVPHHGKVFEVKEGGDVVSLILPIEGKGLWSTLYGFIALSADTRTILGITFYEHGETPGLGGEVDNPRWKALWEGRKAFDAQWEPKIAVKKGAAGPVESDPYQVDGLSGATVTSRGVTYLVRFWLGEDGFGPFLAQHRSSRGI